MGFESNLQSSVLEYLNGLPDCRAENVSGNASQSGRPDITGCYRGRMFKIELKTPDNKYKASRKQELELRRWRRAGAVTAVVYSMSTLRELFSLDWTKPVARFEITERNGCQSWYCIPEWRDYFD